MRHLYQQALQAGDTVLWTPSIFAGLYLHGEGQVGLFHPFHQLLYRLLPLGTAFNLELIANYPLAFGGNVLVPAPPPVQPRGGALRRDAVRVQRLQPAAPHHINMVAIVAHMPWLLAAADVLIVDERRRARTLAFAAIAVILGSEFLLGFPQAVWWNAMTLAAFGLFRAGETRRWRQLVPCGAAVALGVLLGGIQLLPSADAAAHSTRMGAVARVRADLLAAPAQSDPAVVAVLLRERRPQRGRLLWFHEFGIYSGAILPVALIWVWIRRRALPERRALIAALTAFAGLRLILALGRYGGLAALLTHLPVLQSLRAPVRYIVLDAVRARDPGGRHARRSAGHRRGTEPRAAGAAAALWIPAALGIRHDDRLERRAAAIRQAHVRERRRRGPGVAIVAAVTMLVYLAGTAGRWAIAALVVVTAVDLAAWGIRFIYREPPRTIRT